MNPFAQLLILISVAGPANTTNAQITEDAAAIADRYCAAMQKKGYSFLSRKELLNRRDRIAAFTTKTLRQPLDEAMRAAMLTGVDRCIDRLYTSPAGKIDYGNGFGSGGEEWMYLNDPDYFLTFQYQLWFGLTHPTLAPADMRRRDGQREWMREYLSNRGMHRPPPREGIRNQEIRPRERAELEKDFNDPMHLLSEPMTDQSFAELQDRFKQFSNGIAADLHDMEVAAFTSRFGRQKDSAGRYGYIYSGQLPFDDKVVDLWGNGPSLHFASNADFRGNYGYLSTSALYDAVRCIDLNANPDAAPAPKVPKTRPADDHHGDLTLKNDHLIAVRGAKIAKLAVRNWFDADKVTDEQLRKAIRDHGHDRISIAELPPMNGPHGTDRSEGEFFIVVQTVEDRLAVINLHNYEFFELMFWCRPRAAPTKSLAAPATLP